MRILFADAFEDSGLEALRSDGFDLDYRPQLDASALPHEVGAADVLVVRSTKVGAEVFEAGGPLGLVIRAGAGHNTIDGDAAAKRAVFVANVPGKNSVAVAELTLGLILALDRRIADNVTDTRSGAWNKKVYSQSDGLMGKTLGIVGLGQIGLAVAERAKSFGLRVIVEGKDRDQATLERMKELGVETVPDLGTLLSSAEIVSIHVPGSSKTKNLVNAEFLAQMRPGSTLINTSRGDVVDEAALLAAIAEKNLRVGIDVFADEPASGAGEFQSALAQHPQVYATHHIGASTVQAQEAIAGEVVAMIREYRRGVARNVVNLTPTEEVGSILVVRHFDRVGVLSAVLGALSEAGLNVQEMQNQVFTAAGACVATIGVEGEVTERLLETVRSHPDVIFATVRR